ncbi:MAG: hypothetical protein MZU97_06870 [Bacillus subtilis]|nr:hypothetical protein [Bacillus subtilis]
MDRGRRRPRRMRRSAGISPCSSTRSSRRSRPSRTRRRCQTMKGIPLPQGIRARRRVRLLSTVGAMNFPPGKRTTRRPPRPQRSAEHGRLPADSGNVDATPSRRNSIEPP